MLKKTQTLLSLYMHTVRKPRYAQQQGVVLIVALIMLAIISLMAAATIKGSGSSEALSSSSRTQSLALQAADAALRYCEEGVQNQQYQVTPSRATLQAAAGNVLYSSVLIPEAPNPIPPIVPVNWTSSSNWDDGPKNALVYKLPSTFLNANNIYKRMPECMVQYSQAPVGSVSQVVITARGFGPEVPDVLDGVAGTNVRKPQGAEVWLQSYLNFE
jgi:type IV pilus assembly protein PilX